MVVRFGSREQGLLQDACCDGDALHDRSLVPERAVPWRQSSLPKFRGPLTYLQVIVWCFLCCVFSKLRRVCFVAAVVLFCCSDGFCMRLWRDGVFSYSSPPKPPGCPTAKNENKNATAAKQHSSPPIPEPNSDNNNTPQPSQGQESHPHLRRH